MKMCPAECGCEYGTHGYYTGTCPWYAKMTEKFQGGKGSSYGEACRYADAFFTGRFSCKEPNLSNTAKPETPQILPAWLDTDCCAYVARAEKCGFRSKFASARFAAKDIYDRLLANYGTTSPEIAKEKDEARAREATAFLNRRAELVNERCRKENALTPLGDQCRAV